MQRSRVRRAASSIAVVLAMGGLAACQPVVLPPPAPDSQLIGCDRAAERVQLTEMSHLDPACIYIAGFDINASGVTLDCQGATIRSPAGAGGRGIQVHTPVDVPLSDVTVRNCHVEGFLNSLRVTRDGFRTLPAGEEYE